jgi:hypothetical protein
MNALNKVMKNKSFQKSLKKVKNPFFQKNSEKKIINELLKI